MAVECSVDLKTGCTVSDRTILNPGTYALENITFINPISWKNFSGDGQQTEFFLNEFDVENITSVRAWLQTNNSYRTLNKDEYNIRYEPNPYLGTSAISVEIIAGIPRNNTQVDLWFSKRVVLDCNGAILTGSGTGVRIKNYAYLTNCLFRGYQYGASIEDGTKITLTQNTFAHNYYGIGKIYRRTAQQNEYQGNVFFNNTYGILMNQYTGTEFSNNRVYNNTFINNRQYGMSIRGGINVTYVQNFFVNNTYQGLDVSNENSSFLNNTVKNNPGSGSSVSGKNNLIRDNSFQNNDVGLQVSSENSTITMNEFRDNNIGASGGSDKTVFIDNLFWYNAEAGTYITGTGAIIIHNDFYGTGMKIANTNVTYCDQEEPNAFYDGAIGQDDCNCFKPWHDQIYVSVDTVFCPGRYNSSQHTLDSVSLICRGTILQGNNTQDGLILNDNSHVEGCTLQKFENGIYAEDTVHTVIYNNTLLENDNGVQIYRLSRYGTPSYNNTLIRNSFINNSNGLSFSGYSGRRGEQNQIHNNTFLRNRNGMTSYANKNNMTYNLFSNNERGISIDAGQNQSIIGNTIQNSTYTGLSLWDNGGYAEYSVLRGNTFAFNNGGVRINGRQNTIIKNVFQYNNFSGLYLDEYSSENVIAENSFYGSDMIVTDTDNIFCITEEPNRFYNGGRGQDQCHCFKPFFDDVQLSINTTFCAGTYSSAGHEVDDALLCNQTVLVGNRSLIGLYPHSGSIIDGCTLNGYDVGISTKGSNILFKENKISNTRNGIELYYEEYYIPNNITVRENLLTDNDNGIYLRRAENNTISNNTLEQNNDGIVLDYSSHGNLISNNRMTNNTYSGIQIRGERNKLFDNVITLSVYGAYGLYGESVNNTFSRNTFLLNGYGIYLSHSQSNTITYNAFLNNTEQGIFSDEYSSENIIAVNDFYQTGMQIYNTYNKFCLGEQPNYLYGGAEGQDDCNCFKPMNNNTRINTRIEGETIFCSGDYYTGGYILVYAGKLWCNTTRLLGENDEFGIKLDSRTYLEGCSLLGYDQGIFAEGGIVNSQVYNNYLSDNTYGMYATYKNTAYPTNITLGSNVFEDNTYGVYFNSAKNSTILSNLFINNNAGIKLYYAPNNFIAYNLIEHSTDGISLSGNNNTLRENIIRENRNGIALFDDYNVIESNTIENNTGMGINDAARDGNTVQYNIIRNNIQYNYYNGPYNGEKDARFNNWGLDTTEAIDASIYDDEENNRSGKVYFEPWIGDGQQNPVVLVHGYCSSPDAWTDEDFNYEEKLRDAGYTVYIADYEPGPCLPFVLTMPGCANGDIKNNGEKLGEIIQEVKKETGARKVDLIASSMGGLVSRSYIESSVYAQDVNQLIMIGTPNHGSTLADLSVIANVALTLGGGFDPTMFHCMSQLGFATVQMSELSSYLSKLNYDELFFNINTWMTKENLYPNINYKILAGTEYPTMVVLKDKVLGVPFTYPWITELGDGIVAAYSLKLQDIGCHETREWHLGELHNQDIYENVLSYLENPYKPQGDDCRAEERITALQQELLYLQSSPTEKGLLSGGEVNTYTITIDSMSYNTTFMVIWQDLINNLSITIIDPEDRLVNDTTSNITKLTFPGFFILRIQGNSTPGNWTVQIHNPNQEEISYTLDTSFMTPLYFTLQPFGQGTTLQPYDNLTILGYAKIGQQKILSSTINVNITHPDRQESTQIQLYDDGLHNDLQAADGYFGNSFNQTEVNGVYGVKGILVTDYVNETIIREEEFFFSVETVTDGKIDYVNLSYEKANEGIPVVIAMNVSNRGNQTLHDLTLVVYDNLPDNNGTLIRKIIVEDILPSQTLQETLLWQATHGNKTITVMISPFDDYIDTNESNNILTAPPLYFNGKPIIKGEQELIVIKTFGYNITASAYDPENESLSCTLLHKPSNKVSFEWLSGVVDVNGTCWTALTTNTTYEGQPYRAGENVTISIRFTDIHNASVTTNSTTFVIPTCYPINNFLGECIRGGIRYKVFN